VKQVRAEWLTGKPSVEASTDLFQAIRSGGANDASGVALKLLNRGVAPQSIFDGLAQASGELLMRVSGIAPLHAFTSTNAMHYAWQHVRDEQTRRLLLLQNCAFLPLYKGNKPDEGARMDELTPLATNAKGADAITEIFSEVSSKTRVDAARKLLDYLESGGDPRAFADAARRLIFAKGTDSHDYKFSAAVLEDYQFIPREISNRYLAASLAYLKGSGAKDNNLMRRVRDALSG